MKKIVCLVLTLLLCLNVAAVAENVPSKTVGDLTQIDVVAENMPENAGMFVEPVNMTDPEYRELIEVCDEEISTLAGTSIVDYFGEVKNAEGNSVDLGNVLGTEDLKVYEFTPLISGNYEASYGSVIATMHFSTPYEEGKTVIVMIGFVTITEDGTRTIDWIAYEGVGIADEQGSGIKVELDEETMLAIQDNMVLLAVISQ